TAPAHAQAPSARCACSVKRAEKRAAKHGVAVGSLPPRQGGGSAAKDGRATCAPEACSQASCICYASRRQAAGQETRVWANCASRAGCRQSNNKAPRASKETHGETGCACREACSQATRAGNEAHSQGSRSGQKGRGSEKGRGGQTGRGCQEVRRQADV